MTGGRWVRPFGDQGTLRQKAANSAAAVPTPTINSRRSSILVGSGNQRRWHLT
jgi:hypothetical protein